MAQDELKVKAVGTVHNVADLGTKPLPRARIQLILYWCNIFTARRERIGEDEHERMAASSANRGQITKLTKMLNRILLLEGLEKVAGHGIEEKVEKSTFPWITCLMFLLVILLAAAACLIYKMWQRIENLERNAASVQDRLEIYNVRIEASSMELHEKSDKLKMYMSRTRAMLTRLNSKKVSGSAGTIPRSPTETSTSKD